MILVFDLQTRMLKDVSLSRSFGERNLYPGKLESKLAELERDASQVIARLHLASSRDELEFTVIRSELELLRKFLFLMHYRRPTHRDTYFEEDHPGNADIRSWISHVNRTRGYTSSGELWLDGLRFYLDTPQAEILSLAAKQGPHQGNLDPFTPPDQWHAVAYARYAQHYSMGIWQAAEGEEFILGDNSYGLWEGSVFGDTGLHHIYPLSPRLALVLKMVVGTVLPAFTTTTLKDLPFDGPKRYPGSPLHQPSDRYTYAIGRLTPGQTYRVNQIILANLPDNGTLLFASKDCMLKTARRFDVPYTQHTLSKRNRKAIQALIALLDRRSHEDQALESFVLHALETPSAFESAYDRAYDVYSHFPSSLDSSSNFVNHAWAWSARAFHAAALHYIAHPVEPRFFPSGVRCRLVTPLPSADDSNHLLSKVFRYMKTLTGLERNQKDASSFQRLQDDVSILIFLESLVALDPNLAAFICPSIHFVEIDPSQDQPTTVLDSRHVVSSGPRTRTTVLDQLLSDPNHFPDLRPELTVEALRRAQSGGTWLNAVRRAVKTEMESVPLRSTEQRHWAKDLLGFFLNLWILWIVYIWLTDSKNHFA